MPARALASLFLTSLFLTVICLTFCLPLSAAEAHLARHPAPSPDGSQIAFSWQGDIWIIPATGGQAHRLTAHPATERFPIWSRDGRWIAFASDRFGNADIFVMMVDGSAPPRRLTYASVDDQPLDFTPSGDAVAFSSQRAESLRRRRMRGLYTVPINGGTPALAQSALLVEAAYSPDGSKLAFVRGSTQWTRHGYRGAANRELWLRAATGDYKKLTSFDGDDDCPSWINDTTIAFRSARSGYRNLFLIDIRSRQVTQITKHQGSAVRFPRAAANGSLIAYELEDGVWTVPGSGGAPVKLTIQVPADYLVNPVQRRTKRSNASGLAVSPNAELAAFIVHGDVFITGITSKEEQEIATPPTRKVIGTARREQDLSWSPNGKSLLFTSARSGNDDLYLTHPLKPETGWLDLLSELEVVRLTDSPVEEHSGRFSPDGSKIAFIRGKGDLVVMNADGSGQKVLMEHWSRVQYDWSPDSAWITYATNDVHYNSEVWIIAAAGGTPYNVSRHPDTDSEPRWSPDGRRLVWVSKRHEASFDVWGVWLTMADHDRTAAEWLELWQEEAEAKKKQRLKPERADSSELQVAIDFDGLWERIMPLTDERGDEHQPQLSPDGKTLIFTAEDGESSDLYKLKWGADTPTQVTKGGRKPSDVQLGRDGRTVFYLDNSGNIRRISYDGRPGAAIPYTARYEVDLRIEREVGFEEAWRALDEWFYDPQMHGTDWDAAYKKYRSWAIAASSDSDFIDVMNLMLGELNASHLEYSQSRGGSRGDDTGWIGVTYDPGAGGPGVLVAGVIPHSPAARSQVDLKVGERIIAVNNQQVTSDSNIYALFADTVDEQVLLAILGHDAKERRAAVIPVHSGRLRQLHYREWVRQRRGLVEKLSQGRLGYLHIQGMDIPSFEEFERNLFAAGNGKEGLIIDLRCNGGGWTTDYLMAVLDVRRHAYTLPRDAAPETRAYPQSRLPLAAWAKPAMVVCNEESYSNAEIFAHAFKELERGQLIGFPTFGGVISTGSAKLLNGGQVLLPIRGWYVAGSGKNMENNGAQPDTVVSQPAGEDTSSDQDTQLERAVKVFLEGIEDDPRYGAW